MHEACYETVLLVLFCYIVCHVFAHCVSWNFIAVLCAFSLPWLDIERVFWGKPHLPFNLIWSDCIWCHSSMLVCFIHSPIYTYFGDIQQTWFCFTLTQNASDRVGYSVSVCVSICRRFSHALWTWELHRTAPLTQITRARTDTSTF